MPTENKPWLPFKTRIDFEYAEFALAAGLNARQNDTLITLIRRIVKGEAEFTLTSHTELEKYRKVASHKLTKVRPRVFESFQLVFDDNT